MTQVEINWQERLVIGATQTISDLKVPKILSSFLSVNNQINVKVRTDTTSMLLEHVVYGEVYGAFVTEPFDYSELKTVYTIPEKGSFISPKNRPNKMQYEQTLLVNSNPNCIYRKTLIHFSKKEFLQQFTYH